MNEIRLPENALVVLAGPPGAGKSTFAERHFRDVDVVSVDDCRRLAGSERASHPEVRELVAHVVDRRLARERLTVVDGANVLPEDRGPLLQLAGRHDALTVLVVFDLPLQVCRERSREGGVSGRRIRKQQSLLRRSLRGLKKREKWRYVFRLKSVEDVESLTVKRLRRGPDETAAAREDVADVAEDNDNVEDTGEAVDPDHLEADHLDVEAFLGERAVRTRLRGDVFLHAERTASALEAMSRFAVDPHWLVYLPPCMAAPATSRRPGLLEHPDQVFDDYAKAGVERLVCEEKHMGSRAVVVLCRDEATARERFRAPDGEQGACYTRTGLRMFDDASVESAFLERLRRAADASGLWDELKSPWVVLDGEILPWTARALDLIEERFMPICGAGRASLGAVGEALKQAAARGVDLGELPARTAERRSLHERFVDAYGRYCWPVDGLDGIRFAPFHVLAAEGEVFHRRDHLWHLEVLDALVEADAELLQPTRRREVTLADGASREAATAWWQELVDAGGEGMVAKPFDGMVWQRGRKLVQPAIKCRGPEFLRTSYGAEYTREENLERLRPRIIASKRSLALRELALGLESLLLFVEKAPWQRVHECVFGVLAMESERVEAMTDSRRF